MAPLFGFALGFQEILVIVFIGILLFGRKFPEVGRSLGKGIVEFKKGLKGIEDDVDSSMNQSYNARANAPAEAPRAPQRLGTTAPKFEEAPAQPTFQPTDSEGKPRA